MMSSTIKQVKIATSILWLLNKAETRNVFFSSTDIFANKAKLHLHSLIIRGLISGELYCAALSKLFPANDRSIRTKNFQSILEFIIGLDPGQLPEVLVLNQKNRDLFIENLTKLEPFELSEHLQVIDAIMSLHLGFSESVLSIPIIIGKLCDFRPHVKDPKKLLEIWFKCMACLSLIENNIKDTHDLIKSLVMQDNVESNEKSFLDCIKFSDKVALIMNYESEALELEQEFVFDYSPDGSTTRDNVKHNFITVIHVFRKCFPKVLEDFKELMLVLNSSHIQISNNLLINIDLFILEFYTRLEEISNHGNRTFRAGSQNSETNDVTTSRTFRIENQISGKEVKGVYHSINKPPDKSGNKTSKFATFGSYAGRKHSNMDYQNSAYEDHSINWGSQKTGNSLLYSDRKSSVPNGLNLTGINKTISSNLLNDGTLKSKFLGRKSSVERLEITDSEKTNLNQTSWLLQSEKADKPNKPSIKNGLHDQKNDGPRLKANETRLRLNMKRQEIEENRRQMQQQLAKERQLLSDRVFKDVAMGISQTEEEDVSNHRARRVSDMKRGRNPQIKTDLVRSRSQDISKSSVEDINVSLNQLKSEISKLTTEQARLSAKIAESKIESVETFSPRFDRNHSSREDRYDGKALDGESIRSMPISWHPYNNYTNEGSYSRNYVSHYPYPMDNPQYKFYPLPYNQYPSFAYGYPSDSSHFPTQPQINSINSYPVSKSLRDDPSSRPSSPGAMSEPSKITDASPEKPVEVNEGEPLTIQNLIKHNKSLEHLPTDVSQGDSNPNHSLIRDTNVKKVVDFVNNSFSESLVPNSTTRPANNNSNNNNSNNNIQKTGDSINVVESHLTIPLRQSKDSRDISKEHNGIPCENDSDKGNLFFVSFEDEKQLKKPPKLQRIKDKDPNNNNNYNGETNNSIHKSMDKSIPTTTPRSSIKRIEKPLAFVINVNEQGPESEHEGVTANKILQIKEKREQERQKNLEKAREATRLINEAKIQKELEKEKIKEERKQKREAIFEAYMVKKLANDSNEAPPTRKESKIIKKPNRAISATPLLQRHEFSNGDPCLPLENPFPIAMSPTSRPDKSFLNTTGMKLFVEPKTKSNKNVILNAIKYCCLAGKVNESLKQQTIEELDRFVATHFMILMRGGCQYRSLYKFEFESECLTKLSGVGPKKITHKMVDKFFKYNSGSKKFMEVTSTSHLSTVIDGITIFNTLWKSNAQSGNQLPSSETSSQAEHPSQ